MQHADSNSVIIHEGYLFKTPPLDKFFMNWKKRWFVLSLHNSLDPSTCNFSYYTDCEKKEKKGSIDIHQIKSVNPVHNKSKENVFSLETGERKFVFKSPDKRGKAIWVAKLLECCSKDGTSFHVTVPDQPSAVLSEAILKVTTPLKVNVISASNGTAVMTIPFEKIRRFGCQIVIDSDVIWFETCGCNDEGEDFKFFTIAAGIERAYQIVQEYKRTIELALREHLIMEEGDQSQYLYSYVVKSHYGHPEFPALGRDRIVQSGLMSLSTSGGALSLSDLNKFARSRPSLPAISLSGPIPGDFSRRNTVAPAPRFSRSPSPHPQNTPEHTRRTLEQMSGSCKRLDSEFDSGVAMNGLDPSRHSAPCYIDGSSSSPGSTHKMTLNDMKKGRSFEETNKSRKTSLAQVQLEGGIQAFSRHTNRDSAIGSASDLPYSPASPSGYSPYSSSRCGYGSGRGGVSLANTAYDHLAEKVAGTSLHSAYTNGRKNDPAYVDS